MKSLRLLSALAASFALVSWAVTAADTKSDTAKPACCAQAAKPACCAQATKDCEKCAKDAKACEKCAKDAKACEQCPKMAGKKDAKK